MLASFLPFLPFLPLLWLLLQCYNLWNQAGEENVVSLFSLIAHHAFPERAGGAAVVDAASRAPVVMADQGLVHPDAPGRIFATPQEYLAWFHAKQTQGEREKEKEKERGRGREREGEGEKEGEGEGRGARAPIVAVLLYRKHVLTRQPYIPQLIRQLETKGLVPLPIFINGVEAHTIVRDLLYSESKSGTKTMSNLNKGAAKVDAVVSTIGFPLVGGPAGSVEAARQQGVSRQLLSHLNVPYIVAAPMLIQDLESWDRSGMSGLQVRM